MARWRDGPQERGRRRREEEKPRAPEREAAFSIPGEPRVRVPHPRRIRRQAGHSARSAATRLDVTQRNRGVSPASTGCTRDPGQLFLGRTQRVDSAPSTLAHRPAPRPQVSLAADMQVSDPPSDRSMGTADWGTATSGLTDIRTNIGMHIHTHIRIPSRRIW